MPTALCYALLARSVNAIAVRERDRRATITAGDRGQGNGGVSEIWYVLVDGNAEARTRADIAYLRWTGLLDDDALVRTEGMPDWVPFRDSALASEPPSDVPGFPPRVVVPPTLAVSDDGWQDTTPSPWRRYFARSLDVLVLGALAWLVTAFAMAGISTQLYETVFASPLVDNSIVSGIATCALVLPITALLLGTSGSTIGKWIFGVRVTRQDGRPIGIMAALNREVGVFLKGMGLGIPLVALFTHAFAYSRLSDQGVTAWDKDQPWVVTHRPQGSGQVALYCLGIITIVGGFILLRAL